MEPARLLPLLASLQMLPWPVSPEAWLPAPKLTVSSQYRVFLSGESVTLTCSAPSTDTVSGIWFFRDGKRIGSGELQQSQSNAKLLELSSVSESDTGEYSCEYRKKESGREITSERSQPISITVTARPPAPTLTVSPQHRVFLRGESVTLTCSAPSTDTVSGIRFLRDGQSIDSGELLQLQSTASSYQLSSVTETDSGEYSCESWKKESDREIPSERSRPISITVTARPPALDLTLSPQHRVILRGESVTLTCSAPSTDTMSRIRFFRDGQEIDSGKLLQLQSTARSYQLWSVSEKHTGAYSCESWKKESRREIPSERSRPISITVTARPPALKLTVSPQYHVFLPGESVTLKCSAPSTDTMSGIRFFRDGQEIDSGELQPYQYNARFLQLLNVSESDTGAYSCESWKKESEREIPSERSRPISITVTARPPAPELTVSPQHRVFLRWESVTLTCSAPSTATVSGIRFFRDGQSIDSRDLQWSGHSVSPSLLLSSVSESQAINYSCGYWQTMSGRRIPSETSRPIPIFVTASLPVPQITVSPSQPVYITGEDVTLTCSADGSPTVSGIRFYRNSQEIQSKELPSPRTSHIKSLPLSSVSAGSAGEYSCESWKTVSGREIKSARSKSCSIRVTDPPPQPELSVDPPSGVVSEGFPLNITCTAPGDARERRFHFYKDGVELVPGDLGSEISTMEPSNSSVKGSVLSIPWAGSNITGEFTCGYEENVAGRWILSLRSWTVNVTGNITMSVSAAHGFRWVREVAVGGSFFLINGLIFLISCCYF